MDDFAAMTTHLVNRHNHTSWHWVRPHNAVVYFQLHSLTWGSRSTVEHTGLQVNRSIDKSCSLCTVYSTIHFISSGCHGLNVALQCNDHGLQHYSFHLVWPWLRCASSVIPILYTRTAHLQGHYVQYHKMQHKLVCQCTVCANINKT